MSRERLFGRVDWYDKQKGFGVIKGDDDKEYFIHHTNITEGSALLEKDMRVHFLSAPRNRGKRGMEALRLATNRPPETEDRKPFQGHWGEITAIRFATDGALVASASADKDVRVWDSGTGDLVSNLFGHDEPIQCLAFTPDNRRLLTGGKDNTLRLWDIADGSEIHRWCFSGTIKSVDCSPDGRYVLAGGYFRPQLISLESLETVLHLGQEQDVNQVACLSPQSPVALTATATRTLGIWDLTSGNLIHTLNTTGGLIYSVLFAPQGDRFLCATCRTGRFEGNEIYIWDFPRLEVVSHIVDKGFLYWLAPVDFCAGGDRVITVGNNELRIWDVGTGQMLLETHDQRATAIAFSPTVNQYILGGRNGGLSLVDGPDERELQALVRQDFPPATGHWYTRATHAQAEVGLQNQPIETKVVGVTFEGRQAVVARLSVGEQVWLRREPHNPHDRNAIRVERQNGRQIGYISRDIAATLAHRFDNYGKPVSAVVTALTGGEQPYPTRGVRIRFTVPEPPSPVDDFSDLPDFEIPF